MCAHTLTKTPAYAHTPDCSGRYRGGPDLLIMFLKFILTSYFVVSIAALPAGTSGLGEAGAAGGRELAAEGATIGRGSKQRTSHHVITSF